MSSDVPTGWRWASLLRAAAIANGQVDPREMPYRDWPLIAPNHLESGTGRLLDVETSAEQGAISGKYRVEQGDVVYSKIRPYLRKVWLSDRQALCSADMYPMRAGRELEPGYLLALLLSEGFTRFANGVSARTGIPKINREELATYRMLLPPLPEQKKIAAILSSVDEAIQATQAVIEQTRRVKEGLLQDLLTRGIGHTRFKETEIGEIPESWDAVACASLSRQISVGIVVKPTQYYADEGVKCWRSANVGPGFVRDSRWVHIRPDANEQLSKSRLNQGDIVVVRTGHPGTACVVPPSLDQTNCVDVLFIRPVHKRVLSEYLCWFINSDVGKRQVLAGQGGLAQQHFNVKELKRMVIAVPPLAEQREIVGHLSEVRASEQAEEAKAVALKQAKAGLLQDLLTGKVRVSV